ncbi:hypothetical protein MY5147_007442 [Beauveria neobassiana]|uniref:Uncharacterized protein n=1 Tax=Beauveria bassiana TaxID=176275 RepID=A0A2S7XYZ7_BEABA|nr:hypothetical protein BB8028_0001g11920 [Beauveria bassiana]
MDGYVSGGSDLVETATNANTRHLLVTLHSPRRNLKSVPGHVQNSSSSYNGSTLAFSYSCSETENLPDFTVALSSQQMTVPGLNGH